MGIRHLNGLIKRYAFSSITITQLKHHHGKVYAIDTSIYIHRFLYNGGNHIEGFYKQIIRLLKNGILPVYIFDGKPPKEKSSVLKERSDKKYSMYEQIEILEERLRFLEDEDGEIVSDDEGAELAKQHEIDQINDKIEKISKKIIPVTKQHVDECVQLFSLMGIPYIHADGEAEWLCAKLCMHNIVDYCVSEDTDILPNGGPHFIRSLNILNNTVIEYDLQRILDCLGLTYEQFVDVCILSGCDYTDKIFGIGSLGAYKLIKSHGNIEKVVEEFCSKTKNYQVPENFDYKGARDLFFKDITEEEKRQYKKEICRKNLNLRELDKFLKAKCKTVMKLSRALKYTPEPRFKAKQMTIEQMFAPKV